MSAPAGAAGAASGRIAATFAALRAREQSGFVAFIMAGDPDVETTLALMRAAADAGADLLEIGVPFSDPMADGPVLQRSAQRALAGGVMLPAVLELVARFRGESLVPIVLFGYANPFLRYGVERLAADAAQVGADGLLCVDMPPEEAAELHAACSAADLDMIFLLAPTSDARRIATVCARARGFIYYVSITGTTGAAAPVAEEVATMVARVKAHTTLPVGVGFGISEPAQAAAMARVADAVVVGSALMRLVEREAATAVPAARAFLGRLAAAVHGARR